MSIRHGDRPDTPADEPAPTITSKARSDMLVVDRRTVSRGAGGGRVPTATVPMSEPAPTLAQADKWLIRSGQTIAGGDLATRPLDEPALTVGSGADQWTFERPATTVCGDPRLGPPGYRGGRRQYTADGSYLGERSMDNSFKLTESDALILQSFDPDYPVQGSRSKKFQQIGNAVPPMLAAAVLAVVACASGSQGGEP